MAHQYIYLWLLSTITLVSASMIVIDRDPQSSYECSPDQPTLRQLRHNEVYSIMITPYDNSEEPEPVYQFPGNLTDNGEPSSEFSICLWFKLNEKSDMDYIAVVMSEIIPTLSLKKQIIYFLVLGVSRGKVTVMTRNCNIHYNEYIPTKSWTHMCVSLNETISTYVNGRILDADQPCHINYTEILTRYKSTLFFGIGPVTEDFMDGGIADLRLFSKTLSAEEIRKILNFESKTNDYIQGITTDCSQLPSVVSKEIISKIQLSNYNSEIMILNVKEAYNFFDAVEVCKVFGGNMLNFSTALNTINLKNFSEYILRKFLIEIWLYNDMDDSDCIEASGNTWNINFIGCKNDSVRNFVCIIPRSTKYKLVGLSKVTYMTLKNEDEVFLSDENLQIDFGSERIVISGFFDNNIELTTENHRSLPNIMGRLSNWRSSKPGDPLLTLTVSTCRFDQFSCDNGQCININETCNFHHECRDRSDERYCNHTQLRPKLYFNGLSGGDPLLVSIIISFMGISDVHLDQGTATIFLFLSVEWSDPRVIFHNLNTENLVYISPTDAAFYWQPNIVMSNVVQDDAHRFSFSKTLKSPVFLKPIRKGTPSIFESKEVMAYTGDKVKINGSIADRLTLDCSFDLMVYPFDVQKCKFLVTIVNAIKVDAIWNSEDFIVYSTNMDMEHPIYSLVSFKGHVCNETFGRHQIGNTIAIELIFERNFGSHILMTFIPCIIIEVIGLSVFAIPLDDLSSKLTVSVSTLIVMATLFSQTSTTLPDSASPKLIDIWMFSHVLFLATVFLLQLVVHSVYTRETRSVKESSKNKVRGWTMTSKPKNFPEIKCRKTVARRLNKILVFSSVVVYSLFLFIFTCVIIHFRE